jgi:glycosyltransferase involved in cell wall biosynthesis
MKTISALVPAYNEDKSVGHVLKTLVESGLFLEVICVNDGSTDSTAETVKKVKDVIFINCKTNKGKGNALSLGIKKAKGDFIMFVDADLSELTSDHIKKMLAPLNRGNVDVVVGYEDGELLSLFSGERIYRRKDLLPLVNEIKDSRFGVEVILNSAFSDKKTVHVKLRKLGHLEKIAKHDAKAAVSNFLKQWFVDVLKQYLKSGITAKQLKKALNEVPKYLLTKSKKHKLVK